MTGELASPLPEGQKQKVCLIGAGPLANGPSTAAPGVANRLWHFLSGALEAGHDCTVLSIEPSAAPLRQAATPVRVERGDREWRQLSVRAEDCRSKTLEALIEEESPEVLVGAGTLLAAATACTLAGDRPVWADFFGDPLAEIEAKAEVMGEAFPLDEHLQVWQLVTRTLARADHFSTVSRRQGEALLGELALAGRLGPVAPEGSPAEARPAQWMREFIHPIPCAVEALEIPSGVAPPDRRSWLDHAGLPVSAQVVLWSGGFNAWADPETLVAGVEEAMDRLPDLHLVATGGALPGYLDRVHERFMRLITASQHAERMHGLGWLPMDAANLWLRRAELAILTDRPCSETYLGARNRLLYHAAARCPILATRGTEVVEEMEQGGALEAVDPADPKALAQKLADLMEDAARREELGGRGYEFCSRHYTFATTSGSFQDFLNQPRRNSPAAPGDRSAPAWIAHYLDLEARQAEWSELARYRSAPWRRLARWVRGRFCRR